MQLLSYTSQTFAGVQDVYDYLAANVPWWDSTANNKLTKDNITVEVSTNNLLFTETHGGQTLSSGSFTSSTTAVIIAITDESLIIAHRVSSNWEGIVLAKSTDGTTNHYGVATKFASGTSPQAKLLSYGAAAADTIILGAINDSIYNMQIIPVYASQTRYKINDTYIIIMSSNSAYNGKLTLNNKNFVQAGGLVLQYTE